MADADWEFIFDGVVGFLTSPLWQLPVMNFIEKNCIGTSENFLFDVMFICMHVNIHLESPKAKHNFNRDYN